MTSSAPFEFTGITHYGDVASPSQAMLAGGGEVTLTLEYDATVPTWLVTSATFDFYPLNSSR